MPKNSKISYADLRVDFASFTYNESLLLNAALHYIKTGERLSYEQAVMKDLDWDYQLDNMAKWVLSCE